MYRRRSSTVAPGSGGAPAVMMRSGSPAACASIVEIILSNLIVPSPSPPFRRQCRLYYSGRTSQRSVPSRRIRVQRPSETAPDTGHDSLLFPNEPQASLAEAVTLPSSLRMKLAAWLRISGQFDDAAMLLDLIEQEAGESAMLLDERAALALAMGDTAAVRACWERRLAGHPAPSARAAFARALLELGELDEAAQMTEELLAEHSELATVRSLAADVALQQGDLAAAYDHWSAQLEDTSRIAPLLAITRIALLGGDLDEARATLSRALGDPAVLTTAQLAAASGLAELLAQPARAQALRLRYARLEAARTAALAAEIDTALGRTVA